MNFSKLQQLTEANTISDALDGFEPSTPEGKKIWKLVQKSAKRKIANMTSAQLQRYFAGIAEHDIDAVGPIMVLARDISEFLKKRGRNISPPDLSNDKHGQELKALEDKFLVPFAKKHGLALRGYLLRPSDFDPDRPSKAFDLRRNGLSKAAFDEWKTLAPTLAQKAQKLEDAHFAQLRSRRLRADAADQKAQSRVAAAMKKEDLQLDEAKKPKKVEDDMVFDEPTADEAPTIDKAAVLAFLKSCDAKCRADVKKKLDKMVEADETKETVKESTESLPDFRIPRNVVKFLDSSKLAAAMMKHFGVKDGASLADLQLGKDSVKVRKEMKNFLVDAGEGNIDDVAEVMEVAKALEYYYMVKK